MSMFRVSPRQRGVIRGFPLVNLRAAMVTTALLEDLVERGLNPERPRLFVIDGSQALRRAIDAVFGSRNKVQRCRKHKERNVHGYLPEERYQRSNSTSDQLESWLHGSAMGRLRLARNREELQARSVFRIAAHLRSQARGTCPRQKRCS